ncbi:response regulator transcription factor [Sulfurimonas sp. C5]|uniref:response regulator transcription factor n=1 Tax=Sulfurimonas sp. C5 TaxID=3036947 RepID=UPI002453BBBE|nr:response regulator transcription factor [Sulfurimonas sp. C5]MDH4944437.1 response regulator transcription factor [Sulfurimonas sp. C5]
MKKNILLLEDDKELALTLKELLEESSYSVELVHNGNDAIDASYDNKYDLYIFDINVPDMNGLELLESLRNADDKTPAIFISALIDLDSISKAFSIGADDYLKKPFYPEELLIRVNAKLSQKKKEIEYENLRFSPDSKTLSIDGKIVQLGEVQEKLCELFMQNIGNVIDKTILLDQLTQPSDTALRVAVNKLKQTTHLPIKNIRGVGYILEKS